MTELAEVERDVLLSKIPTLSEALIAGEPEAIAAIKRGPHQVAVDLTLFHWAPGNLLKEQTALTSLGFVDILEVDDAATADLRDAILASFRAWAASIKEVAAIDLNATLERKLSGEKQSPFRLLVPVEALEAHADYHSSGGGTAQREIPIDRDGFLEGMEYQTLADFRRRHPDLVRAARNEYRAICRACDFDFEATYGDLGKDYIEMHHLHPIKEGVRMSRVEDLRPVCANCHRMIHRNPRQVLSISELRSRLGKST